MDDNSLDQTAPNADSKIPHCSEEDNPQFNTLRPTDVNPEDEVERGLPRNPDVPTVIGGLDSWEGDRLQIDHVDLKTQYRPGIGVGATRIERLSLETEDSNPLMKEFEAEMEGLRSQKKDSFFPVKDCELQQEEERKPLIGNASSQVYEIGSEVGKNWFQAKETGYQIEESAHCIDKNGTQIGKSGLYIEENSAQIGENDGQIEVKVGIDESGLNEEESSFRPEEKGSKAGNSGHIVDEVGLDPERRSSQLDDTQYPTSKTTLVVDENNFYSSENRAYTGKSTSHAKDIRLHEGETRSQVKEIRPRTDEVLLQTAKCQSFTEDTLVVKKIKHATEDVVETTESNLLLNQSSQTNEDSENWTLNAHVQTQNNVAQITLDKGEIEMGSSMILRNSSPELDDKGLGIRDVHTLTHKIQKDHLQLALGKSLTNDSSSLEPDGCAERRQKRALDDISTGGRYTCK